MSLLLEALKKAEKAKEEAQRRAREGELRLEELAGKEEAKPVLTRPELPDIREPLEIRSDDIAPKPPEPQPAPPSEKPASATPQPGTPVQGAGKAEARAVERAAARRVFEAKFKAPNPRMPFYVAIGALGMVAIGVVGYFWYQLRPPPALVNVNPAKTGNPIPAAAAAGTKPAEPTTIASGAIPGLPGATNSPAPAVQKPAPVVEKPAPAVEKPAPRVIEAKSVPTPAPRAAPAATGPAPTQAEPSFSASRSAPQVHPKVESGYAAYLSGDLATARADYQQALREDGGNRDALLGLAATDVRAGRHEAAEATYLRLLQADPNDAHAQAALIALRGARLDPLVTESRVKSMLAADPGANVLHFTLGNQLAQQGRWGEAQQEYFKAFAAEPENADFAYNLAVSLDHLRQPKVALQYYQRAIALAEQRGASFDLAAARARAAQLTR